MTVITVGTLLTFVIGIAMVLTPSDDAASRRGSRIWGLAMIINAAGWLVAGALRPSLPLVIPVTLGNALLLISLVMCLQVIAGSKSVPVKVHRYYLILLACCASFIPILWLLPDNSAVRVIIVSAFSCFVYARVASLVLLGQKPSRSEIFTGLVFLSCAVALLVRIVMHISPALGYSPAIPMDDDINAITYLSMSLASILMTFGYLLMGHDHDISHLREIESRMRHLAQHDALTNLPNRALFSDRLQRAIANAKRNKQQLALMFLDINRFKPVNDRYGHAAGDIYLQQLAQRLKGAVRDQDTVARVGGDEFVILLPVISSRLDALTVANKVVANLQQPIIIDDLRLPVFVSVGIACYPEDGDTAEALHKAADRSMYAAKSAGDNEVHSQSGPYNPRLSDENIYPANV